MKEGLNPSKIDQILVKIKPRPVVALVDDDTATLDLLERALGDKKYELHRFERAEDLLERFSDIQPDLIVMEAILPGMSGLSVLEELRPKAMEGFVPVLILTKKDELRAKLLAFQRGALDYVTKPFDTEEVHARVRALLRSKLLQDMIRLSAISDPLTSLYNRRFILSWLEREIPRTKRYGQELSGILMDLDGFDQIKEEKGENFGDDLLRQFSSLLTRHTRRSDLAARLENGEFLLLLPEISKEKAVAVARRLRALAKPSFCTGIIDCHSTQTPDPPSFLERVEEALKKAKSVGVGQTAVLAID